MRSLFLIFFSLTGILCLAQSFDKNKKYTPVAIGFWNCENFYDTLNDPLKDDEEFLPTGNYGWTGTKYKNKLDHLSDVISQLATETTPDGAAIMGLCEIENRQVLEDLIKMPKLKSRNYKIVHVEGPDKRG